MLSPSLPAAVLVSLLAAENPPADALSFFYLRLIPPGDKPNMELPFLLVLVIIQAGNDTCRIPTNFITVTALRF